MPEYKLPSDSELSRCFIEGMSDPEIAARYGCTRQAVNAARHRLGYGRRPYVNQANALIGTVWRVQTAAGHQTQGSIQGLRLWLRKRLGDDSLSARQKLTADNFEARIRREEVVLQYDPSSSNGFSYVPREPQDGHSVIRWPDLGPGRVRDPEAEKFLNLPATPTD
ncbi:hypothetical protein [Kitasatospora sp. MBT66]|uniref:hypothetical protein n=1 Tax=Kitasatospora sp. MBT66 TaxID=1444769 RepID=UPI0005BE822C|nr:hypothetical protein [Kitasatospora sp. MBT66]